MLNSAVNCFVSSYCVAIATSKHSSPWSATKKTCGMYMKEPIPVSASSSIS
jgi:hypothetical protein